MRFAVAALLVAASAAIVLATRSSSEAADTAKPPKTERIGKPLTVHAGPRVSAAQLRKLLKRPPRRPSSDGPELNEDDDEATPRTRKLAASMAPQRVAKPLSPAAVSDWDAATGKISPPDPEIAASSSYVVVGINSGIEFYTKAGNPISATGLVAASGNPSPAGPANSNAVNYLDATDLFFPLINPILPGGAQLNKASKGKIDNFSDLRVVFDPYRRHFLVVATGACRSPSLSNTDVTGDGKPDPIDADNDKAPDAVKCAFTLKPKQRRSVIGLAVSVNENPLAGWYLYWWDAAVGWGTADTTVYKPGDLADYPSVGVNAVTIDVTVSIKDDDPRDATATPTPSRRSYPSIALVRAIDVEGGLASVKASRLYPIPSGGGCSALHNPDGSCPVGHVQPTFAHPDPGGSILVARYPSKLDQLVVWRVTDLLQPQLQKVTTNGVQLPFAWPAPLDSGTTQPTPALQKGGGIDGAIDMSVGLPGTPFEAVWRGFLWLVCEDTNATNHSNVRLIRLYTNADSPGDIAQPPVSDTVRIGAGSTLSYGWPAVEVNKNHDAVVDYTVVGKTTYASMRYNAWLHNEPQPRYGRILAPGKGAYLTTNAPERWGDVAGAAVDFVQGKEAEGIWVVHQYGAAGGGYAIHVSKIFGATYPDLVPGLQLAAGSASAGGDLRIRGSVENWGDKRAPRARVDVFVARKGEKRLRMGSFKSGPIGPGRQGRPSRSDYRFQPRSLPGPTPSRSWPTATRRSWSTAKRTTRPRPRSRCAEVQLRPRRPRRPHHPHHPRHPRHLQGTPISSSTS